MLLPCHFYKKKKRMAKKTNTLAEKFNAMLPSGLRIKTKDLLELLASYNIDRSQYYRDLKASPENIPNKRLQVYAGLLNCEVAELIDSFMKVKPLVKKSLGSKVSMK